jgi:ABC-type multidrug transport system fused ATPase/permease subunit
VFLTLLRIIEVGSGVMEIDGVNIATLGLRRLRDSISIIPQDAVLFNTTLRYNLDPTGLKQDSELWRALEICELSEFVKRKFESTLSVDSTISSPLDAIVAEGGADFSFGQRQLLCIARALLRDTRILLSDEASSGIDRITDQKIQAMIAKEFASRTTVTIAHRLETIVSSDFVAVMENGQVAEFDDPAVLLKNNSSRFFKLANDMRKSASGTVGK